MKQIKKILVPTDFSNCARDAYHTALDIAERIGATVEVVHFYVLPTANNLSEGKEFLYTESEFLKAAEVKMDTFLNHDFHNTYEAELATKVNVKSKIKIGFAGEKIIEYSKNSGFDLIVLGASGESPNYARFFGSIASDVASKAHCPVLLVPKDNRFARFNDVIYASNEYSINSETLKFSFDWAKKFQSTLHFIHVKNIDKAFDNYTSSKMFEFIDAMDLDTDVNVIYETVIDSFPWRGLYTYADGSRADLMIVVTKHRSFFENLIHHGLTESISADAHLPVLVLHSDDELT